MSNTAKLLRLIHSLLLYILSTNVFHLIKQISRKNTFYNQRLCHRQEYIMMLTAESLERIITERLDATVVKVEDMSGGCGQAFAVVIVSNIFAGKNKLERHRLVNNALRAEIAGIHAFTQKGLTPEEYAETSDK